MEIKCAKCNCSENVKNGIVFGQQRYKCKKCGYQFTKPCGRGKPINLILTCHGLYAFGLSMRQIARTIGVSAQTISRWISKWNQTYVNEIGSNETLYKTTTENLIDCLNLEANEKLMVTTQTLPSGAKIHVVITM